METLVMFAFLSIIAIIGGVYYWIDDKKKEKEQPKHGG